MLPNPAGAYLGPDVKYRDVSDIDIPQQSPSLVASLSRDSWSQVDP